MVLLLVIIAERCFATTIDKKLNSCNITPLLLNQAFFKAAYIFFIQLPHNRIAQLFGMLIALIVLGLAVLVSKSLATDYSNFVQTPNGGDIFYKTRAYQIAWNDSLVSPTTQLELWLGTQDSQGLSYVYKIGDVANKDHFYNWTVPNWLKDGATYVITIRAVTMPGVNDSSNYTFAIVDDRQNGAYEFITPRANETWRNNGAISWRSSIPQKVVLRILSQSTTVYEHIFSGSELFNHDAPVNSQKNDREFIMHVDWPLTNAAAGQYTIQVFSDQALLSRELTIIKPTITISAPTATDKWIAGQAYTIRWQTSNVSRVGIQLLWDTNVSYTIVSPIDALLRSYTWTIPANFATSNRYAIRIVDVDSTNAASSGLFSIVNPVSPNNTVDNTPTSAPLLLKLGFSPRVYDIIRSRNHWIPTVSLFNAYGYNWDNVRIVDKDELAYYPRTKLIQAQGDYRVYYLTDSYMKRQVPNPEVFASYQNRWDDVMSVLPQELSAYPDSVLIRAQGSAKVYKLENGVKYWIKTAAALEAHGFSWSKVAPVNQTELDAYPTGAPIQ